MAIPFTLYWLFVTIFGIAIATENSLPSQIDPDCEHILEQVSRFPPSHAIVTRCCGGTGVRYECINGNQLVSGDTERICNNSELIGQEPTCAFPEVLSCGNPGPIEHGYFVGSHFTISSKVTYSCHQGFKLYGHSQRTCMDDGQWTEQPICIFEDEMELDLTNATDVISNSLLHNLDLPQCADSENPDCEPISRRRRAIDVEHGGGLDIVFMFDGSNSIKKGEFRLGLRFARDLLRMLDGTVRRGGVRVAALSFAVNMKINLDFTTSSLRTIRKVWSIKRPNGCGSNLGRAMFLLRKRIAPKLRRDSKRALFIVTNGKLVMGTSHKRASRLLQTENRFEVFVIGIGKTPNKDMLSTLVSEPVKEHFIGLKVYSDVFTSVTKTVVAAKNNYDRCGISTTKLKSRSIRGNKAASGVWPWQLGIYWGRGRSPLCGGALISNRWVITAAHCFYSNAGKAVIFPPWRYTVKVGDIRGGADKKQMAPVDSIFLHKDYKYKSYENDIALVKLQYEFKLGKHVRPVCLPKATVKRRKQADSGKHGFVVEWTRQQRRSRIVVHNALTVSPAKQCKNMTSKPFNTSKMFCVMHKKSNKKNCREDGGSAFVTESYDQKSRDYRWSVDGLVSWDENCGKADHHRYFTSVLPYSKWIDRILKEGKPRRRY